MVQKSIRKNAINHLFINKLFHYNEGILVVNYNKGTTQISEY